MHFAEISQWHRWCVVSWIEGVAWTCTGLVSQERCPCTLAWQWWCALQVAGWPVQVGLRNPACRCDAGMLNCLKQSGCAAAVLMYRALHHLALEQLCADTCCICCCPPAEILCTEARLHFSDYACWHDATLSTACASASHSSCLWLVLLQEAGRRLRTAAQETFLITSPSLLHLLLWVCVVLQIKSIHSLINQKRLHCSQYAPCPQPNRK